MNVDKLVDGWSGGSSIRVWARMCGQFSSNSLVGPTLGLIFYI